MGIGALPTACIVWRCRKGHKWKFVNDAPNSAIGPGLSLTIRERLGLLATWRHAAALIAVILLFAWLAPFGTGVRFAVPDLLLYWALAIGLNWVLGVLVFLLPALLKSQSRPAQLGALAAGALVAAVPGCAIVFLLESWMGEPPRLASELASVYASVALVHLVIGYLAGHLAASPPIHEISRPGANPGGRAPFLARLSPHLGENLLHLRMQDHYVEAITDRGSELVLMRFGDALREVKQIDGVRVHRSHWVAVHAVRRVRREPGKAVLELGNGTHVPVSRSYRAVLTRFESG